MNHETNLLRTIAHIPLHSHGSTQPSPNEIVALCAIASYPELHATDIAQKINTNTRHLHALLRKLHKQGYLCLKRIAQHPPSPGRYPPHYALTQKATSITAAILATAIRRAS